MSDKSAIAWTEATWNPTTGCTKVSPGCKFCYAKHKNWPRLSANPKTVYFGRKFEDVQVHPERLDQPLRWRRPRMIFVDSMSDLFHEDIPDEFIDRVFAVMALADRHIFQVLTKRPERMRDFLAQGDHGIIQHFRRTQAYGGIATKSVFQALDAKRRDGIDWQWPLPNVWLGTSVENQETADERIPLLLQTSAAIRWISAEPLLGEVDLRPIVCSDFVYGVNRPASLYALEGKYQIPDCHLSEDHSHLDWVVVGGESGPKARPMRQEWALVLREQCRAAGVPFFMKQGSQNNWPDYKDISRFHPDLQVREYPLGDRQ